MMRLLLAAAVGLGAVVVLKRFAGPVGDSTMWYPEAMAIAAAYNYELPPVADPGEYELVIHQ